MYNVNETLGSTLPHGNRAKGQLNSELIYEVIVYPKMPTKKLPRFLPYALINFQGKNLGNFWLAFWEKRRPHKCILNLTGL